MAKLTAVYDELPISQIKVDRAERQRRDIRTDNLLESIRENGIINPLVVDSDMRLVAGERRLECARELGLATVPVRFALTLDAADLQLLELDENLRRSDLPWRDQVAAVAKLHELNAQKNPQWTQEQTAVAIGASAGTVSQHLRIARDLANPKIATATGLMAAYNILARADERKASDALSVITKGMPEVVRGGGPSGDAAPLGGSGSAPAQAPAPDAEALVEADFNVWAPSYTGRPFNFIHCDFPYGIDVFSGPMGQRSDARAEYGDQADVYWQLCQTLCTNLDRLMAPSAHLMFWFSMQHYEATLEYFRLHAPSLSFQPFPLVWVKSDNVGIAPDPRRGYRRVYETALVASREDRPIVKVVSNAYSAPTDKRFHHSTKPEPVLRHFFTSLVDEHTRMLDPTCGGGSAIRVAEAMGAAQVLGLERDPEHLKIAQSALRSARFLRQTRPNG